MKPLKIASRRWPETIFAASLKPNDTALDKYKINSIKTRRGSKARGINQNEEKNSTPCFWKPRIVAPRTILKLKEKARIKCEVNTKLYSSVRYIIISYDYTWGPLAHDFSSWTILFLINHSSVYY